MRDTGPTVGAPGAHLWAAPFDALHSGFKVEQGKKKDQEKMKNLVEFEVVWSSFMNISKFQ
jgi:hypothetical protein